MRHRRYTLALADCQTEDDIDRVFSTLQQIKPPDELISRILSQIGSLPTSAGGRSAVRRTAQNCLADVELDIPIVYSRKREPS